MKRTLVVAVWLLLTMAGMNSLATFALAQETINEQTPGKNTEQVDKAQAEAKEALKSLSEIVKAATSSRATVELTTRGRIGAEEISNEQSVYQIASKAPASYAAFYKSKEQTFRIFCDGKEETVVVTPQAYFKATAAASLQDVVTGLPAPLGPYPEPVMALTLCGADANQTLMSDMKSVVIVDRDPYNNTSAVHLRGVQADEVSWDLWIGTEQKQAQPLRMVIDLTAAVRNGNEAKLPENFSYELEFLFTLWRMNGEVDPKLFTFLPPKDAVEYESLEDLYKSLTEVPTQHELVGKPTPEFEAVLFDSAEQKKIKLSDLKDKVVVLDFWATWCGPCIAAMPVIAGVTKKYADQGVVFLAVNSGEEEAAIKKFFEAKELKPDVLLDATGAVADAFKVEAIPQTVIIGKNGKVEAVHVGYSTLEALEKELGEQLEVLTSGGSLLAKPEGNGE